MKILTNRLNRNEWTAVDDDRDDGSPVGLGHTEEEAIEDLLDQIDAVAKREKAR